jgi:adenosylcobinamide-GDP ribazoletransferase
MKKEWQLFLTAVMFYTRIPVPSSIDHAADKLNQATRYLPFIGWITGAVMIALLYALSFVAPLTICILLSLVMGIWLTGAFHEDGFADMCDGFGGGWTKEKILDIMKDSRVGTYGMLGLMLLMLTKFFSLQALPLEKIILAIAVAHPLSRLTAVTIIYTHNYVRENEDSKAKPLAKGITTPSLIVAAFWGLIPFIAVVMYLQHYSLLIILPALLLVRWYMVRLMQKWIGGYTGDCLGAMQQVAETIIYLCFCIVEWKYI